MFCYPMNRFSPQWVYRIGLYPGIELSQSLDATSEDSASELYTDIVPGFGYAILTVVPKLELKPCSMS